MASDTFSFEEAMARPSSAAPPSSDTFSFDEAMGKPVPKAKTTRTWSEAASDTGRGLMSGGAGVVKGVGDLYGLATGDMDNAASQLGQNAQQYWEEGQSDALKAKRLERKAAIDAEEGIGGKAWQAFKGTVTDPALAMDAVSSNIATMVPGMAVGRVAQGAKLASGMAAAGESVVAQQAAAQAAARLGTGAAIGVGALQQGADVSGDVYSDLMKKPDSVWAANPDFMASLDATDRSPQAIQSLKEQFALKAARLTLPAASAISVVANKYLPGADMLERALVGGAARETIKAGTKYGLPKAIGQSMFGGTVEEAGEEGVGAYAGNIAKRAIVDPNQDLREGVGENAGMGAAGGMLMGAAGGAMHRADTRRPADIRKDIDSVTEDFAAEHGIPAKAMQAARQRAESMPLGETPGFYRRFLSAYASKTGKTIDDNHFSDLDRHAENLRMVPDESPQQTMDDVLALEKNSAPGADFIKDQPEAQAEPAQTATETIAEKNDPPIEAGMTRLYHGSAQPGRYDGKAWFSSDRQYAQDYRKGAELQYVDVPTDRVNAMADPDGYGNTPARGFTFMGEFDSSDVGIRKPITSINQPQGINEASQAQTVPRETAAPDAVPAGAAAGNAGQPLGSQPVLATGGPESFPDALNGVLRDTNPQAGTAAQAETAPGQAAEVAAVDEAGQPAAGDAAGSRELQANGIENPKSFSDDPARWNLLTEQRRKNPGRVVARNAVFAIEHTPVDASNPYGLDEFQAINSNGEVIGTLSAGMDEGIAKAATQVAPESRRKGIASALYETAEKTLAVTFEPDTPHTAAAAALWAQPDRKFGNAKNTQSKSPAQAEPAQAAIETVAPVQLGRDNIPLTEGGKPFKSKLAADNARKLNNMTRTVRVEGGFVLTEKSEAQLAAQEKAARRLSNPQTSPAGEAIPAHAFIASEGGLSPFERADMGMEGNVNIGNRKLFAGTGKGLTIEHATEKLVEEGYLQEHDHQKARDLIKRSLTNPQYTPEGTEFMAEKESTQREADYYAEQEAVALLEEAHDNDFADAADAFEAAALGLPESVTQSEMALDDAMRVAGFTEEEIQHATANQPGSPQAGSNADAGTAETTPGTRPQGDSGRAPAKGEDSSRRGEEVNGTRNASSGSTGESARRESAGDVGKAADRTADATQSGVRGSTDELRPAPQSGLTTAPTVSSASEITYALRDSGSLAVKGNPQAIRDKLKGITKMSPMEGGMMVGKTQAQRAIDILSDKPVEAPAARPLSVGITPATAEAVTVKDGKVFIGSNEAVNFDSGDAVTVKPGATDAQIVQALKDAGALSRRQKVFGLQDAAQNQSDTQENSDKPAPDALKSAPALEAKPERNEALIELRKRVSVLKAFIKCMGG